MLSCHVQSKCHSNHGQNPTDELMNYMYSRVGVTLNQFNLAMSFRYDKQHYIWQGLSNYATLEQLLIHTPSIVWITRCNILGDKILLNFGTKFQCLNLQFHMWNYKIAMAMLAQNLSIQWTIETPQNVVRHLIV